VSGQGEERGAFWVRSDALVEALAERAGQLEVGLWQGQASWLWVSQTGEEHGLEHGEQLELAFIRSERTVCGEGEAREDQLQVDWLPVRVSELAPAGRILVLAMPLCEGDRTAIPFIIQGGSCADLWLRRVPT
jgi:hypothetical protein